MCFAGFERGEWGEDGKGGSYVRLMEHSLAGTLCPGRCMS